MSINSGGPGKKRDNFHVCNLTLFPLSKFSVGAWLMENPVIIMLVLWCDGKYCNEIRCAQGCSAAARPRAQLTHPLPSPELHFGASEPSPEPLTV